MTFKSLTTKSGSTYRVYADGSVYRTAGSHDIVGARYEYTKGFFTKSDYPDGLDDIDVGKALLWYGIVNDFTEPIKSTPIVSVTQSG